MADTFKRSLRKIISGKRKRTAVRSQLAPKDPEVLRINRELNALLGTKIIADPNKNKRTRSQMDALRKQRRKRISKPLILLLVLAILAGGLYGGFQHLKSSGKRSLLAHEGIEGVEITAPESAEIEDQGSLVRYNGKTYRRNPDIISILALGTDEKAENPTDHEIGNNKQADTLFVAALDSVTGEMTMINISRDSIVDVDLYNTQGEYVGTEPMQICLAHAYGTDEAAGCENTIKSVSRLLYGMPIDAYGSITVPAISVLNDALGGVEVTVLEDLGSGSDALKKGEKVTLKGKQVNTYVISRDQYSEDANNARMARQRQYLTAFINKAFASVRRDPSTVFTLYDAARSYITSDLSVAKLTYLATLAMNGMFREQDIRNVPGEITLETGIDNLTHAQYHVDDEALYQIILDVYYNEVSE